MSRKAGRPEAPGNSLEAQRLFDNMVYATGRGWLEMVRAVDGLLDDGIVLTRLSMKGDWRVPGDGLIILTARGPDGPIVCFHKVDDVSGAWAGLARRLLARAIEWRTDEYARE